MNSRHHSDADRYRGSRSRRATPGIWRAAARPGRQQIGLTITRLQLAAPSRIILARIQVSFDQGQTWHAATVTRLGDGSFRAIFSAPAGARVSLRTHAVDAAGDTVTDTILGAYRTSAATG
jgi:hypothetical protein